MKSTNIEATSLLRRVQVDGCHERAAVVGAVAFAGVRLAGRPLGVQATVGEGRKATIDRIGSRVPHIVELFGVTPEAAAPRRGAGGPGAAERYAALLESGSGIWRQVPFHEVDC